MNTSLGAIELKEAARYWDMLKDLSDPIKLDLIGRLSASMIHPCTSRDTCWLSEIAGAWRDSRATEEIIEQIHADRTPNREIEL